MTDEAKLVEELARIIDPSSWAVMDGYLKDMLRKYKGENAAYDPDAFKHKASMKTARAVLASPTFTRLRNPPLTGDAAGLVERLNGLSRLWFGYSEHEKSPTFSRGDCREFSAKFDEAADTITRLIAERDGAYERAAQVAEKFSRTMHIPSHTDTGKMVAIAIRAINPATVAKL